MLGLSIDFYHECTHDLKISDINTRIGEYVFMLVVLEAEVVESLWRTLSKVPEVLFLIDYKKNL